MVLATSGESRSRKVRLGSALIGRSGIIGDRSSGDRVLRMS